MAAEVETDTFWKDVLLGVVFGFPLGFFACLGLLAAN